MMSHSNKHIQPSSSTASAGQETSSGPHSKMSDKSRTVSDSESEINYDLFNSSLASDCGASVMNSSQISNASNESTHIKSANLTRSQNLGGVGVNFSNCRIECLLVLVCCVP